MYRTTDRRYNLYDIYPKGVNMDCTYIQKDRQYKSRSSQFQLPLSINFNFTVSILCCLMHYLLRRKMNPRLANRTGLRDSDLIPEWSQLRVNWASDLAPKRVPLGVNPEYSSVGASSYREIHQTSTVIYVV